MTIDPHLGVRKKVQLTKHEAITMNTFAENCIFVQSMNLIYLFKYGTPYFELTFD